MTKLITILALLLCAVLSHADDWTTYNTSNSGLASNNVKAIVVDENGNKWFGTDQGLSAFDGATWQTYTKTDEKQTLADNNINDLVFEQTSTGPELWVATGNGATVMAIPQIDAVTFATPYRLENTGIINNMVTAVAVDPVRQERWFGTSAGLSRFSESGWRNFDLTTDPILAWTDVTCIGIDVANGWKYVGTQNGTGENNGVARLRTSSDDVDAITAPSPYNEQWSGLWSGNIYAALVEPDGSQWFGTEAGFGFHDSTETKSKWDFFTIWDGLPDSVVQAIVRTDDLVMWVGTSNGLSKFKYIIGEWGIEKDYFINFSMADGLAGNDIRDLAVDQDGSLWIATNNGVSHFTGNTGVKNETPKHLPRQIGLVKNYPNPFNPTTTISYSLPERSHVELDIYNMRGERIYGLVNTTQSAGTYDVLWNGRLSDGQQAPTGIYIAKIKINAGDRLVHDSLKMLMVK